MTTTTIEATDDDPEDLPGESLDEWLAGILDPHDPTARFFRAVGAEVITPGGKMDATLLLSDPALDRPSTWHNSFAKRLTRKYAEQARVIYKADQTLDPSHSGLTE